MKLEEFKRLTCFFHDGSIDHIEQFRKNIYMWMESAQLLPEWIEEFNVKVNDNQCIKGVFHCINVKSLMIDHVPQKTLQMNCDSAEILDFDIVEDGVQLLVVWRDRSDGLYTNNSGLIKIIAQKFYWRYDEYVSDPPEIAFQSSYKPVEMELNDGSK